MIYFDNAATTYPKPAIVLGAMVEIYKKLGLSPGRGSYDGAVQAQQLVDSVRLKTARFFGASQNDHVVFAANATDALNIIIQGIVNPGDHIVASRLEHNSVLRPLNHLHDKGIIEYDLVPFNGQGMVEPDAVKVKIKSNTAAVIITHVSNVLGTVQPIREISRVCQDRQVPLIVDVAQSAGLVPIKMSDWGLAAIAFTGHKSLFGPSGIGGLVLSPQLEVRATRYGGTGVDSSSLFHTQTYPHRLEAGTLNLMGVIGLSEGMNFVLQKGIAAIHRKEMALFDRLRQAVTCLDNVEICSGRDLSNQVALMTLNIDGMAPADVGAILDADFGICVRNGLHCAPLAHMDIGTYPQGGVRFSLGPFNTDMDIERAVEAIVLISRSASNVG